MKVYNDFDDWRSHNTCRHAASPTKSLSTRHSLDNNRPNRRIDVPTSTITNTENESSEEYKHAIMNWDIRFTSPLQGTPLQGSPLQGIDIDSSTSTRTLVQRFSIEEDEDETDYDYDCFIPVPHRHLKAARDLFDVIFQLSKHESQKSTCTVSHKSLQAEILNSPT